ARPLRPALRPDPRAARPHRRRAREDEQAPRQRRELPPPRPRALDAERVAAGACLRGPRPAGPAGPPPPLGVVPPRALRPVGTGHLSVPGTRTRLEGTGAAHTTRVVRIRRTGE